MRSVALEPPMHELVKRMLTWLAVWYDPAADARQHARVVSVTTKAEQSADRAALAIDAYRRETTAYRRRH